MNARTLLNEDSLVFFVCWAHALINQELQLSVELKWWMWVSDFFFSPNAFISYLEAVM